MAAEFFTWGAGGAKLTPEQLALARAVMARKKAGGVDTSPVGHWTAGAARVADALGDVLQERRLNSQEADLSAYNAEQSAPLIAALSGNPSATVGAALPAATATGAASTPAAAVSAPVFGNDGTELGGYLSDPARRATLPAGMRNNNPGNIKFVGQKVPGIVGPSVNTDQGDPQAVFATPEAGMNAMYNLLLKKYAGGKTTPNAIIAGNMGWTPGNFGAAANVAKYAGIGPDDDISLRDPTKAARFMKALITQEHGKMGALYPEQMILSALGGQPAGAPVGNAAPIQSEPQAYVDPVVSATNYVAPQPVSTFDNSRFGNAPQTATTEVYSAPSDFASSYAAQPQAHPQQVAQAAPVAPSMPQAQSIPPAAIAQALRVIADPRANEGTRRVAQALIGKVQAQEQAAQEQSVWQQRQDYQRQQLASDPLRQLQIQKAQQELAGGSRQSLVNAGDGRIYDPNSQQWITAPDAASRNFRQATPDEVKAFGTNGQVGPDGKFYPITPPQGTALSVDPTTGAVTFNQGAGVKPLTEAQSKDSFFTTRMTAATPTIDKFESALMSLPEAAAGAIPMNLGRYAQSEEFQLAKDAGRDFVNAYLRKDSGAALTAQEEANYGQLLLPQPGDKPAILAAKRQRRQIAVEAIKSGMPPSAVDGMLKAIQSVPGADKPAETTNEKKTRTGVQWSID